MDVQIDRFLADASEGAKEHQMKQLVAGPEQLEDEAVQEERTSERAKTVVKLVSRNLKLLSSKIGKYEKASKEHRTVEAQQLAKIDRLGREVSELKDQNTQESQIEALQGQNKQLEQDKAALVKTLQGLMGTGTAVGKLQSTMSAVVSGAKAEEQKEQQEYKTKVQQLESDLAKEKQTAEETQQALEEEEQKNENAKGFLDKAAAENEELQKEKDGVQHSLDQVQAANEGLVKDKGQLMGTLRSLLNQNSELRKDLNTARHRLGMKKH